jgi:anaerobic magnesium-protoporphyrin IX monomethyl ester cyclase
VEPLTFDNTIARNHMKVLLINPVVRLRLAPYVLPVGLGIIAAVLLRNGHDVNVYDENFLRPDPEKFKRDMAAIKKPDVIGIGGLITTYNHLKTIIPVLKAIFPKAIVVLGGGITVEPQIIFENMSVDYCVHGEGEHTLSELINAIEENHLSNLNEVMGISYRDNQNHSVITTPPRLPEKDLDLFPDPAYHLFRTEEYFANCTRMINKWDKTLNAKRCAPLVWSRGCPNECTFCWRMMGRSVRFRSVDRLINEIKYLRSKYDVDSYLFLDECINASRRKAAMLSESLVKSGLVAPWYSHARSDLFDQEVAYKFRRSGCIGLNFGIESASPEMLKVMNKNVSVEAAKKAVAVSEQENIAAQCTFIIGTPGETEKTILTSVDWIKHNQIKHCSCFYFTPYPGCKVYASPEVQKRIAVKFGSKDEYFSKLGDANNLVINLTDLPDSKLETYRQQMSIESKAQYVASKRKTALANIREAAWLGQDRRKILFGLGKKGKDILEAMDSCYGKDETVAIDLIIDDAKMHDRFQKWPVMCPDQVQWRKDDIVFLATDTYQDVFRCRLKTLNCPADIIELF